MHGAAARAYGPAEGRSTLEARPASILSLVGGSIAALTPLERLAVRIGAGDPRPSKSLPTSLRCRLNWLFGLRKTNALADPYLEALRALAVGLRHSPDRQQRAVEVDRARAEGVTDAVIRSVTMLARTVPVL